jgi:O-antigen ligase
MTKIRWVWELMGFALLSVIALYAMAPFRSNLIIVLVLAVPFTLVFLAPSAARALVDNSAELAKSFSWWHWLVLLAILSGLNFHTVVRDVKDVTSNPLDAEALFRIGVEALTAAVLLKRLVNHQSSWLKELFRGLFGFLTLFVIISIASTFWSVNPLWSLYKSVEYGVDVVLIISLVLLLPSMQQYKKLLDWIWTVTGVLMVVAWVSAIIDPVDGFSYGLQGNFPIPQLSGVWPAQSPNGIGTYGAIIATVALSRIMLYPENKKFRGWYWMLFGFSILTMIMTDCRTAIAGLALAILILLFLTRRFIAGAVVAAVGTVAVLLSGFGTVIYDYLLRGQHEGEVATLTGRTEWWSVAWQFILQRPFFGWGAFAGGRFIVMPHVNHPDLTDVDSSILEPLLDTGIFGLLFLLLALAGTWWYLNRGARGRSLGSGERLLAAECMAVLGVITFRCFFVSNLIRHPAFSFIAILGFAEMIRRHLKFGAGSLDGETHTYVK